LNRGLKRAGRGSAMLESGVHRGEEPMPEPACQHKRTQLIAKDDDAQYVECLDCGEILETGELPEPSGFDESLSDA
jgi:hypothetical protein